MSNQGTPCYLQLAKVEELLEKSGDENSALMAENKQLREQVEILTNLSLELVQLAVKLDPVGGMNFCKTVLEAMGE